LRVFVDTNLWAYRLDRREQKKATRIAAWLRELAAEHEIVVSTQVLVELRSVLTRKFDPPFDPASIETALVALTHFEIVPTDHHLVLDAHALAAPEQLSWFDALIVEAALRGGCWVLFTEDLQDGRRFGELEVRNPLRED
jgi:predicted nucleic acid-binding protein